MEGLVQLIALLEILVKAYPTLAPVVKNIVLQVKAEIEGRALTDAEKAAISATFDSVDAALEKAIQERIVLGDQEAQQ